MSFFVLLKGSVTKYNFDYINKRNPKRLDDTKVANKVFKHEIDSINSGVYAIEIMTKGIQVLAAQDTVNEAMDFMSKYGVHHIPIIVDNRLVGLVSYSDINQAKSSDRLEQYMTKTILAAHENTALRDILQVLMHENIRSLPMVDDNFKVTGILTINDVFKWMLANHKYTK